MLERGIFCQNFGGTWLVLRFFCFFVLPVKPRGPDSQFLSPLEIRPDQRFMSARGYELQGGGDDAVRVSAHAPPGVPPAREGCLPGHYCQGHPAVGQDRERGKNIYIHVSIYIHQCNTPLPRAPAVGQDREQAAIYIV
jgi:hypothetical protein